MAGLSIRRRLAGLLLAALAVGVGGCAGLAPTPPGAGVREALAPTGTLRVAVYPGSPTSLVDAAPPERMRGVTVDLGRLLAARLGVPAQIVVYPRVAEVVAAVQRGEADFTITNATPERAKLVDFAQPLVDLELGVLVPAGSRVSSVEAVDAAGVVVGVSQGSSSERALSGRYVNARLRTFPTLEAARAALQAREIDAFATNKGILFELLNGVPSARILDGRWGSEHLAPALPKGRAASGVAFVESFAQEMRTGGELQRAADRAGLKGTVPPQSMRAADTN